MNKKEEAKLLTALCDWRTRMLEMGWFDYRPAGTYSDCYARHRAIVGGHEFYYLHTVGLFD